MNLRERIRGVFYFALIVVTCAPFILGQATVSDKYLITAKAGGVNYVSGDVTVERENGTAGRLIKGDEVQIGERVSTGSDGRAEILMNPGSYIRLGSNSSFEFVSTDLDDVRLKIHSGSAILEVFGTDGFNVDLSANTARFTILETGVYRIDASTKGTSTVAVWRGKLRAGLDADMKLGGGKVVTFDGKSYVVMKFDRDDQDDLAVWSRDRSKELSKISSSLKRNTLRDPLINSFFGGRWDLYNSFGLWVYDPFFRSFCFLPFGYGWSSPYGYGFGRSIWYYNLPVVIYSQPPPQADWRARGLKRPDSPSTSSVRSPNGGSTSEQKRPARDVLRDVIPRERRVEPIFDMPRMQPVIPSAPSGPAPSKNPARRP